LFSRYLNGGSANTDFLCKTTGKQTVVRSNQYMCSGHRGLGCLKNRVHCLHRFVQADSRDCTHPMNMECHWTLRDCRQDYDTTFQKESNCISNTIGILPINPVWSLRTKCCKRRQVRKSGRHGRKSRKAVKMGWNSSKETDIPKSFPIMRSSGLKGALCRDNCTLASRPM